jgi:hypothetical protein
MANQTELDKLAADTSAMWLDDFDQQRAEIEKKPKTKPDDWEEWGAWLVQAEIWVPPQTSKMTLRHRMS